MRRPRCRCRCWRCCTSAASSAATSTAREAIARGAALHDAVVAADAAWPRLFHGLAHERRLLAAMTDTQRGRPDAADLRELLQAAAGGAPAADDAGNERPARGDLARMARRRRRHRVPAVRRARVDRAQRPGTDAAAAHRPLQGWAQGMRGDAAVALPRLRAARAELEAGKHRADRAALLALAATLALRAGAADEAQVLLDRAFAHAQASGERCVLAQV